MATLSKIVTASALVRLEGRFLRYGGIPGAFSGGGLASALWSFDWPASTTPLPQAAFLTSLFFARCGDERRQRDRRAYRRKAGPGVLITSAKTTGNQRSILGKAVRK